MCVPLLQFSDFYNCKLLKTDYTDLYLDLKIIPFFLLLLCFFLNLFDKTDIIYVPIYTVDSQKTGPMIIRLKTNE